MIGLGMGLSRGGCAPSLARRDLAAYSARLAALGKALSTQAHAELLAFATALYANYGRLDFIPARSAHNVGSGSTLYSFQGIGGTLTSGPTWTNNGVAFGTSGTIQLSASDAETIFANTRSSFAVFKTTRDTTGYDQLIVIEGGTESSQYIQHSYTNVSGQNSTRATTTRGGAFVYVASGTDFQSGEWLSSAIENAATSTRIWENGALVKTETGQPARNPSGAIATRKIGNIRNGTLSLLVFSSAAQDFSGIHAIAAATLCKEQIS